MGGGKDRRFAPSHGQFFIRLRTGPWKRREPDRRRAACAGSGDAQGMNMIAKGADAVCRWSERQYPGSGHFLFSGMCSEKRASGFIISHGKGKRVTAGALVPHSILKMCLPVTAEQLFRVW